MAVAAAQHVERSRFARLRAKLAGPALLFVIISGIYWKLTLTTQYTWANSPDIGNQVLPWYQFQAVLWHRSVFPLWNPHEWGGQPLIGQMITGAAYPLNWILFLMPLHHGWLTLASVNWYYVLIHYMAALFCFFLLRDLERGFAASLLGSVAFAAGGYFATITFPQMLNGAVWTPLVFLFGLRAVRGERPLCSSAISGMFLGVALLSGHHQVPIFIGLAMAGVWLYHLARQRTARQIRTALACIALFGVFALLAGGLQTLPAIEYGRLSLRWAGASHPLAWNESVPYRVHAEYGMAPEALVGALLTTGTGPCMGLVALSMAIFAVARGWRDRMVRLFGAVTLLALLFAMGDTTVFEGLIYALVPGVEKARSPHMALFMYGFGISALCAYGVDSYSGESGHRQSAWSRRLIFSLSALGLLVLACVLMFSMVKIERQLNFGIVTFGALMALLLAAALQAWSRGYVSSRAGSMLVACIMLLELGSLNSWRLPHRDDGWQYIDKLSQNADIVEFLREQPAPVRAELDRNEIPYNFGDWNGMDVFDCYLASLTRNIETVRGNRNAWAMLGLNFYIGRKPRDKDQADIFTGASGIKVWANPGVFPRVWSVHQAVGIRNRQEIQKNLDRPSAELARQTFLLDAAPVLESCAGSDEITLVAREASRVAIDADMRCKGMVVAGETYFPGWKATVDGRPAQVHEAYSFLRGVVVDGGKHRIEMRYRPASVFWGAGMTSFGIAAACALARFGRRSTGGQNRG
jgi:hypothetical protein